MWAALGERRFRSCGLRLSGQLAPKRCFIAAQPIVRKIRQISQTQKAAGELDGGGVGVYPNVLPSKSSVGYLRRTR